MFNLLTSNKVFQINIIQSKKNIWIIQIVTIKKSTLTKSKFILNRQVKKYKIWKTKKLQFNCQNKDQFVKNNQEMEYYLLKMDGITKGSTLKDYFMDLVNFIILTL